VNSPLSKAAKTLLALGPERAAEVLRHLAPEEIEKLTRAIANIDKVDPKESEKLLHELEKQMRIEKHSLRGGSDKARNLLEMVLGKEKAQTYIDKMDRANLRHEFREFEDYAPEVIAQALSQEYSQIAAVILTQLSPVYAAKVLPLLEAKADIARRIARMQPVSPEVLESSYKSLSQKLQAIERDSALETDGEDRIARILSYMDTSSEENILENLRREDTTMAERIRDKLFLFEELIYLSKQEIRKIFEMFPDNQLWAKALKGAGSDLQRHILSSFSINRASDIMDEMTALSPLRLKEVEDARRQIMKTAEDLHKRSEIYLRKDRDELVE